MNKTEQLLNMANKTLANEDAAGAPAVPNTNTANANGQISPLDAPKSAQQGQVPPNSATNSSVNTNNVQPNQAAQPAVPAAASNAAPASQPGVQATPKTNPDGNQATQNNQGNAGNIAGQNAGATNQSPPQGKLTRLP